MDRGEGSVRGSDNCLLFEEVKKMSIIFFELKFNFEIDAQFCKVEKDLGIVGWKKIQSLECGNILIVSIKVV